MIMNTRATTFGFLVFLIVLGLVYLIWSLQYDYWSSFGPGAGFLPRWLAGGYLISCLGALANELRGGPRVEFDGRGMKRIAVTLGLMAAATLLTPVIGLVPSLALLMFLVAAFVEKNGVVVSLGVSIGVSVFIFAIFGLWLGVQFPEMYFFEN